MRYLSMLFLLILSSSARATSYDPILENIKPGTITIVGENHKRIESVEIFQSLVSEVIQRHQCVVIGLEIASGQQNILDEVMQGRSLVSDVALWPPIDHPAYRRMLGHFADLKRRGQCITLAAVDSGSDNVIDRDLWMALSLAEQPENTPILVLLGALHTLKRVNWTVRTGRPSVAEILATMGFRVKAFPQRWFPDQCAGNETRRSRFVSPDSPEALKVLNESLMSLINAKPHKSARGVVDGFIIWTCA